MKYHKLKNFVIATAAATLYYGYIAPNAPELKEIFAVLYVFTVMMFLLGEADRSLARRRQEKKKSASVGKP